ncbi:MAG: hypothetical protein ACLP8A_18615 [Methylovirgula sp.]
MGLSLMLAFTGAAFAASSDSMGATSGPASGSNVQPGVAGRKGSKNGPAVK